MKDVTGKVAVVTGASRGIGRAIADALAAHGVHVVLGARSASDVSAAAAAIMRQHQSVRALGVACDVRVQRDCEQLIEQAIRELGRLDILINNAGIGRFAPVADLSADDWRAVIETNLNGVFYCTHAALPHLKRAGTSWIINIGSLAGKNAFPRTTRASSV
jgi:3-oxoacyl-[acyl-carrier protein] reductase